MQKLRQEGQDLVNESGQVFDLDKFSRFKHGSTGVAAEYGSDMARSLAEAHPELLTPQVELVVSASFSKFMPLASDSLGDAFYRSLNYSLVQRDLPPADRVKIHRSELIEGDYSKMSQAERDAINEKDKLSLPEGVVRGKHLLVVDDVRMTGGCERKIDEYVQSLDLLSVWYLYAAQIDGAQAQSGPQLEARMNTAYVNNLERLAEVVTAKDFLLNSRAAKFIIGYDDKSELRQFLGAMDDQFVYNLYTGVTGNGYNRMEKYGESVDAIEGELGKRRMIRGGQLYPARG